MRDELCVVDGAAEAIQRAENSVWQWDHNWYATNTSNEAPYTWLDTLVIARAISKFVESPHRDPNLRPLAVDFLCRSAEIQYGRAMDRIRRQPGVNDQASRINQKGIRLFLKSAWIHFIVMISGASEWLANPENQKDLAGPILAALTCLDLGFDQNGGGAKWQQLVTTTLSGGGPCGVEDMLKINMAACSSGPCNFVTESRIRATILQLDYFLRNYLPLELPRRQFGEWSRLFTKIWTFLDTLCISNPDQSPPLRETAHRLAHTISFGLQTLTPVLMSLSQGPNSRQSLTLQFKTLYVQRCTALFPGCGLRQWLPVLVGQSMRETTAEPDMMLQLQLPNAAVAAVIADQQRRRAAFALYTVERLCLGIIGCMANPLTRRDALRALLQLHMTMFGEDSNHDHSPESELASLGPTPPAALALVILTCESFKIMNSALLPKAFELFRQIVLDLRSPSVVGGPLILSPLTPSTGAKGQGLTNWYAVSFDDKVARL